MGSSLLTARGIPMAGEYEVRTMLAMLICDRIDAGGSSADSRRLTSLTASSRWATTDLRIWRSARSSRCWGLSVYHGKRGWGVSVEFDVKHGPVTTLGVAARNPTAR